MPPFSLVIFDCDGTLVDTERVGNQVIVEQLQSMGHAITLEEALSDFAGRRMAETLELIEKRIGAALPEFFLESLRDQMNVAFEARLETMPGVPEALDAIVAANIPACVASNGPHEKMVVSLGCTRLLPYFEDAIFSGYDCASWKPAPDLFWYVAERMGVPPSTCAVIEDSAFGVSGGIAAGMTVFGYAPRHDGENLRTLGARVFHDMRDLPGLLQI
jgi:HAD superfamily hydrolase (TIGR01509 family)